MLQRFTIHLLLLASLIFAQALLTPNLLAEEAYWEYTFRPGDSIWKLAKTHTTSVKNWLEIQKINNISQGPDRTIQPGTRIKIPVRMLKVQPAPTVVTSTSAGVMLIHPDDTRVTLSAYNKLISGDTIITLDNQFVGLRFADGSTLNILPNSSVSMDRLSQHAQTGMLDTQVRVQKGSIDTRVNKQLPNSRYNIITPSAVTAVRGTQFRVSSDLKEITRTEVTQGIVEVSAENTMQNVNGGYGVIAEKGKPISKPIKLLEPPVLKFTPAQTLNWQTLSDARAYRYQIASDDNFKQIIKAAQTSELSVNLATMEEGSYFVRLRGIDNNGLEGLNAQLGINIKAVVIEAEDDPIWPAFIPATIFLIGL